MPWEDPKDSPFAMKLLSIKYYWGTANIRENLRGESPLEAKVDEKGSCYGREPPGVIWDIRILHVGVRQNRLLLS